MPLLRLLLAFALTIAIPLQGFAAARCMCKLPQAQESAAAGASAGQAAAAAALAHLANAAWSKHGATSGAANLSNHAGPAAMHAGSPSNPAKPHGACPKCSMNCCQVAVSPPGAPAIEFANADAPEVAFLPAVFASWSEPVPDKPPRS